MLALAQPLTLQRIVRLWDMLNLYAKIFVSLQSSLINFRDTFDNLKEGVPADEETRKRLIGWLKDAQAASYELNLIATIPWIVRLRRLIDPEMGAPAVVVDPEVRLVIREVLMVLEDELCSHVFLHVTLDQARRYEQVELFGKDVHAAFSRSAFDISEAGSCLALDRPTAAVFHLMCALETPLESLAHQLGVPLTQKPWGTILADIEDKVASLPAKGADKDFYSRVVLEFRFFKDAWRNPVAHAKAHYCEREAMLIFDHVRAFMVQLATKIRQCP